MKISIYNYVHIRIYIYIYIYIYIKIYRYMDIYVYTSSVIAKAEKQMYRIGIGKYTHRAQ